MRFKHKKRGTSYEILDIIDYSGTEDLMEGDIFGYWEDGEQFYADFQMSNDNFVDGQIVLYYPLEGVGMYARPASEFFDGRFERI